MSENITAGILPVLALRGLAVFPDQTVHFEVGRVKSVKALEQAMKKEQNLLLIPQKDISCDDPGLADLQPIGTVAKIKQILRPQGETVRVLVTGLCRARIQELNQTEPYLSGMVVSVPETEMADSLRAKALRREANAIYASYLDQSEHPAQAVQLRMLASKDCGFIADSIAQNSGIEHGDRVTLLLQLNPVPAGVSRLVFVAPAEVAKVYTAARTEISELVWRAYWSQNGVDADEYVGKSSYYELLQGDKLYFGAVTEAQALQSKLYDSNGALIGTIDKDDLRLVESFGGAYGIYCFTAPEGAAYAYVSYDSGYEQYYLCQEIGKDESVTDSQLVANYIRYIGVQQPAQDTVTALSGKTALFLGDSITYGARDRACIYGAGGWAGRIGYYAGMDITNNGVSGACISTARKDSHSEGHYILNNLLKTKGTEYDYVIMHGLFNDASEKVALGTAQGKAGFDPAKADATTYAGGLELLFYHARLQNPDAILGFIVNFETERNVDQEPYADLAIAICQDWGIAYLDLYHKEGFTVEFDDGLHPSSAGYDSMYTLVANWMAQLDGKTPTEPTNVMSYNVFWGADVPSDKGLTIAQRYEKVAQLIRQQSSDIVLLQEYTDAFAQAAESILTEYSIYGKPHTDTGDECAPIGWKTNRYELVASGTFWASETPDTAYSESWCESAKAYPRAINWVVLKDKTTAKQLLVINVHGQPNEENANARIKTMALVAEKAAALSAQYGNIGIVIGGDMNMGVHSDAYQALTAGGIVDARLWINPKAGGSYSDWDREESKFAMGDYLFVGGGVNAESYQVITGDLDTGREDNKTVHISDHCPIVMEICY